MKLEAVLDYLGRIIRYPETSRTRELATSQFQKLFVEDKHEAAVYLLSHRDDFSDQDFSVCDSQLNEYYRFLADEDKVHAALDHDDISGANAVIASHAYPDGQRNLGKILDAYCYPDQEDDDAFREALRKRDRSEALIDFLNSYPHSDQTQRARSLVFGTIVSNIADTIVSHTHQPLSQWKSAYRIGRKQFERITPPDSIAQYVSELAMMTIVDSVCLQDDYMILNPFPDTVVRADPRRVIDKSGTIDLKPGRERNAPNSRYEQNIWELNGSSRRVIDYNNTSTGPLLVLSSTVRHDIPWLPGRAYSHPVVHVDEIDFSVKVEIDEQLLDDHYFFQQLLSDKQVSAYSSLHTPK